MNISSTGSEASQISSIRPPSAQDGVKRANPGSAESPSASNHNAEVNKPSSPTVNTSGQTVGRLINVTA